MKRLLPTLIFTAVMLPAVAQETPTGGEASPAQQAAAAQGAMPVQKAPPTLEATPTQEDDPTREANPTRESTAIQPAPAEPAASAQQPAPAEQSAAGTATILYKSGGDAINAFFRTSTSAEPCADMTQTAGVYDAELLRKKLLGFIAKAVQKANAVRKVYPQVETTVQANVPMQVMGYSVWADSTPHWSSSGSCGPFTRQFTPVAGRKYQALFTFTSNTCSMSMQDITDSAAPAPVETTRLECKRPGAW